ncbi:MAG: TA system antitoxin ParD family protein [Acidobacteriota bacterium]
MSNGIPVRLSAELAARARTAAATQERSVTEQVEHWARLGQVVEDAILAATVQRLKARSHDPELSARLARSMTAEGRAQAAQLIRRRNRVRYGTGPKGSIRKQR